MTFALKPWQLLVMILAGWVNRRQQAAIDYLRTENQVLREKLGKRRILLDDNQRRRLAVKGKVLGRKLLGETATLFTPDTILRWHHLLVAQKWDYSQRRQKKPGRPALAADIRHLILRLAQENPRWGYARIQGALANLGHQVSDTSVAKILKEHGIEPAPDRKLKTTWKAFIKAHWHVLAAIDFTTIEVWGRKGLVTFYLLFVMEVATRRVHFAGATCSPEEVWMKQAARNMTDGLDGFVVGKRYLLMDRDAKFCAGFRNTLREAGVKAVRLPPQSPNLNANLERFFLSLKSECLDRVILFSEDRLRLAITEFLAHYHAERNHQGLGNRLIETGNLSSSCAGRIRCRQRLGGLLRYYYRQAA
jgi:transposase InsO family protein